MTRLTFTALALAAVLPMTAIASSDDEVPEADRAAISDSLKAQGYEIRKMEREDGAIEVYAVRDGKRYELYLDPDTREIIRVKEED